MELAGVGGEELAGAGDEVAPGQRGDEPSQAWLHGNDRSPRFQ